MFPRIKYHTGGDDCKLVNPPPPLFSNSDVHFLLNQRSFTPTPTPPPPPPILMGFSEGKLCSDSFIHVIFLKRMSKIVLVSTLILLIFFFIFSSFQFMLVFTWFVYISKQGYMSIIILLLKWIFFHSTWSQHFPFDHIFWCLQFS